MLPIEWSRRTEIHRNAMLDNPITFQNLIENMQGATAVDHVILRDNLEPAHHWFFRENVLVMRYAKAYPNSEVGETIERICRHLESLSEEKKGRGVQPRPIGVEVGLSACPIWADQPMAWSRRSRSRRGLCKSSCLRNRCHRSCNRLCLHKSSAPYRRAFQSCRLSCPC